MRQGRFPSYDPNERDDPIDFMDPQNLTDAQNLNIHRQRHGRHNPSSRHANPNTYTEINHFPPSSSDDAPNAPNASDDDFTLVPVMNGSSLPPLSHKPVQLGQVDQWSISMVDELVQSAFSTLQLWMREREQLQPVRQAQPKARGIHYDNVKSAMAEERLLAMLLMQPALFEKADESFTFAL